MIGVIAWLTGSSWGRYVALGGLAAAAIALVVWRVYGAGKTAAKTQALERTINALQTRISTDDALRTLSPDARRDRLRRWASD